MAKRILLGVVALLPCLVGPIGLASAVSVPGCGDFVIVARDAIRMDSGPTELLGNLMVTSADGLIDVGRFNVVHGTVRADTLRLGNDAQVSRCAGNTFQGVDPGTVCGATQLLTLATCVPDALFNPLAALSNLVAVDSCVNAAPDFSVPANTTGTLPDGSCVGLLRLGRGAVLSVSGTINARQILMSKRASLVGPATINVLTVITSGPGIVTDSITLNVAGTIGDNVATGNKSRFINTRINVPGGSAHIRVGSIFEGDTHLVARRAVLQPLSSGPPAGNNFVCPEDPKASAGGRRECDRFVGDVANPGLCQFGNKPVHPTWQQAINGSNPGDVICVCKNTTENVVIDNKSSLTITQCTNAKVTAAINTKPVVTIRDSASNILIIGADTIGGSIGWCLEPGASGHELRGVRASDANSCGILDRGSANEISFNSVTDSRLGVCIAADTSTVRGGTVQGNGVGVIFDDAANSSFTGARVQDNGSAPGGPAGATSGIALRSNTSGNEVRDNRCGVNLPDTAFDICDGGSGNVIADNNDCSVAHTSACILPIAPLPANCD